MALGLTNAGYVVAACDLPSSAAEMTILAEATRFSRGALHPVYCDLTDADNCRKAVEEVRTEFGAIDILVNDAAIGMEVLTPHIHNNPFKFYEVDEAFCGEYSRSPCSACFG